MPAKSICAFAKISSRDGIASHISCIMNIDPMFEDDEPEVREYGPDRFVELIADAQTYATNVMEREVPIICVCDGMYDLCLSWSDITSIYMVEPVARSSTEFFALSLYNGQRLEAVIFDLRHIMPRGLPGMAEATGIDRDGTEIQDCRIMRAYANRVQVRHKLLIGSEGTKLGSTVLTLTGLARHEIDRTVGKLSYMRRKGRSEVERTLRQDYMLDARVEAPRTYHEYAMRRACMRGGFSFVAAVDSNRVIGRTVCVDETSAHHAHAIGHYVPEGFKQRGAGWLQSACDKIVAMSPEAVMTGYAYPFPVAIHAEVRFSGLRLREGSVFERQEIGLESTARLAPSEGVLGIDNESMVEAERAIRERGYGDRAESPVSAFSKIMRADVLTTWVTELELWCMSRVYEWDSMEVTQGEAATKRKRPDDYAILTSMHFWREKQELKQKILEASVGSDDYLRLKALYDGEIKPKFNAVGYGLHARDEYRPAWTVDDTGAWVLEDPIDEETFDERRPEKPRAWFNYGLRISGWSRLHLILAMELVDDAFGDDARIVAGDTDSLKIRTELPENDILRALAPLHDATRRAREMVTRRARDMWPDEYDPMDGVGEFVAESTAVEFFTSGVKEYVKRMDDGTIEVTCAGVPKYGEHTFGAWVRTMADWFSMEILTYAMGFDVTLSPGVAQLHEIAYDETDPESFRLPPVRGLGYTLNSLDDEDVRATIAWQREHGREIRVDPIARCEWTPAGPRFSYGDGNLDGFNS